MSSKRQQTMAKMTRERAVKEKRARKLEKKHAAALERKGHLGGAPPTTGYGT
jgi:hypothetical protein